MVNFLKWLLKKRVELGSSFPDQSSRSSSDTGPCSTVYHMAEKGEKKRSVKQKIRDTQRLLAREELPETVRLTKERILKALQQELNDKQQEVKSKKIAKKYRMVKFFEKRKVTRKLKSTLRELSSCTDDSERAEILPEVNRLRRELNYIVHYPPWEKYIALYPSSDSTNDKTLARRDKTLSQITEQVENGDLPDASESFGQLKQFLPSSEQSAIGLNTGLSPVEMEGASPELKDRTRQLDTREVIHTERAYDKPTVQQKKKKRFVALVDEEPDSQSELHLESRKKLKEDDFFL